MTTRVIKIVIDSTGAKKGGKDVERALEGVDRKSKGAEKSLGGVKGALILAAGAVAAGKIIEIGDAWASLQGQLRLVTSSSAELENTTKSLFAIAQKTRQELGATADLYIRLGRSTDFSNERILQLTETIGQTIALSRATPQAAQAALFQLGQGFAAGALRGEELNSVLEQTPELAKAISDGLGITVGQLRILGAEGELTAEKVAGALENSAAKVNEEFSGIPLTVGDALTKVGNSLTVFIGTLDQSIGATSALAATLDKASEIIQGLNVILGDDKGFGAEAGRIEKQINAVTREITELQNQVNTGFETTGPGQFSFRVIPEGEKERVEEALEAARRKLEELKALQLEIIQNKGLTNAEVEAQKLEDLRAQIAKVIGATNALFQISSGASPLEAQIEAADAAIEALQERVADGLIDEAEANELRGKIENALANASQRSADAFVESFKDAKDKAAEQIEILDQFVQDKLIDDETAAAIREKLTKALGGGEDSDAAKRFVDSFRTAGERAKDQIDQLDAYVKDNLIDEETAQRIRDRLERIVAKELIIEVKADVQAVQDTEQRIADLQGKIQAFNEGGAEGLRAFESYTEARDILAELGDEATVSVEELTRLIATEKELEEVLGETTRNVDEQADAIEDFYRRARENSQDIFADFLASGLQGIDDFEAAFSQMLLNLASQALAAQIFEKILGPQDGSGGGLLDLGLSALGSFFGGAAQGADVSKGDFGIVGEEGPEVFQAPARGTIVPNAATQAASMPQVNVGGPTIVNAIDDGDIVAAFNRGGGGQTILNYVTENASAVRQGLGIA